MNEPKSKVQFDVLLRDGVFFISAPCLFKMVEENHEIDLIGTIKNNLSNLQNAIQGLPVEDGFKAKLTEADGKAI